MICRGKIRNWLKLYRDIIQLDHDILSVLWLVEIISQHNWIMSCSMCRVLTQTANHNSLGDWRHNEHDGVSNHQPHDCLFNRLFRRRSKKISKLRVTGLCEGNPQVTGEFPSQRASNVENVSIWWRHHVAVISSKLVGQLEKWWLICKIVFEIIKL